MDWKTWYKDHVMTAGEAVQHIKSGNRVVVAHATGEPSYILDAMVANAAAYENVEVLHMVAMGKAEYCKPEYDKNFHHNAFFLGATTRGAASEGRADFTPVYFSEIPGVLRDYLHPNVVLLQCSTPDEHGYVSLGVSVDYTKPAAEMADIVIAQVNKQMPRTLGDSFLHVTQLDCIVETDLPVIELAPPKITDVERGIGENVASLIKDGDTLQLGIGAIPDAVLLFLKEKNDLGIHTEMLTSGMMRLAKMGVINGKRKQINKGKIVTTFAMGVPELYEFMDYNPGIAVMDGAWTNDPYTIAQNDNQISINTSIEVDLTGQCCSESIGSRQFSGSGGQADTAIGAQMSKGGKSIIALYSTAMVKDPATGEKKEVSKIVPQLMSGAAVTLSRNDVDRVVTEYGVAELRGTSIRDRVARLIEIAHPKFREELWEQAVAVGILGKRR